MLLVKGLLAELSTAAVVVNFMVGEKDVRLGEIEGTFEEVGVDSVDSGDDGVVVDESTVLVVSVDRHTSSPSEVHLDVPLTTSHVTS